MKTQLLGETFKALAKEGQFTKEMLGAGATQIRRAYYATKGIYFQAFTSLSTGLERIGQLCFMLDHYIEHVGQFPDESYMKRQIGHNISLLYNTAAAVVLRRKISLRFRQNLDDPIHQAILKVLSDFAEGDRYANINLVVGARRRGDPVAAWYVQVDERIYARCVPECKKRVVLKRAAEVASAFENPGVSVMVLDTSETGSEITDIGEASLRKCVQEAVAPYRQLYVLQIVRYWVELLGSLQNLAMHIGSRNIPFFSETFAPFYNSDSYLRTRKTWDKV